MQDNEPGAGGGGAEATEQLRTAWHEGLTSEHRADKTIAHYVERNDLNGMAAALVTATAKIGERPLAIPRNGADEEEWTAVWTALGRPESAGDYDLSLPEGYEPGELEKETHPKIRELFHKAGLTARQAKTFTAGWNDLTAGIASQLTAVERAAEEQGNAQIARLYPDRRRFEADEQAGLRFAGGGDAEFIETLQALRLSNGAMALSHPSFRIALARIGAGLAEDQSAGAGDGGAHRYASATDVEAAIAKQNDRMANDPSYALHPDYKGDPENVRAERDARAGLYALRAQKRGAAA